MKIQNWLIDRVGRSPNQPAIIWNDNIINFEELYSLSLKYAYWLQSQLPNGGKVAIFLGNCPEMIALIHATSFIECELVLINARLSAKEIKWQLEFLETDILISSMDFGHVLRDLNIRIFVTEGYGYYNTIELSSKIEKIHPKDGNDILCYVFTSGTTGQPKAVPLTYDNFYASATASAERLGVEDDDKWLLSIPLYHLGGLSIVFRSVISGITINLHSKFDESKIIQDLENHNITIMSLVPVMLKRLLPHFQSKASLRLILLGGNKAPQGLLYQVFELELPVAITYGMTETCSQFATALPGSVRMKPLSVGKPLMGGIMKIFRADNDGIGEIGVKGPMVMNNYYKSDAGVFEDGFLLTGDLGYIDSDANLYIKQRRNDLIISGGENIYPSEIEMVLSELPQLVDICVIGVEDQIWGQIPIGILELKSPITALHIENYLGNQLARYKIPKYWYSMSELPRTSSGKIKRSKVHEAYIKGLDEIV